MDLDCDGYTIEAQISLSDTDRLWQWSLVISTPLGSSPMMGSGTAGSFAEAVRRAYRRYLREIGDARSD